jgi:hypothetical protein
VRCLKIVFEGLSHYKPVIFCCVLFSLLVAYNRCDNAIHSMSLSLTENGCISSNDNIPRPGSASSRYDPDNNHHTDVTAASVQSQVQMESTSLTTTNAVDSSLDNNVLSHANQKITSDRGDSRLTPKIEPQDRATVADSEADTLVNNDVETAKAPASSKKKNSGSLV